MFGFGLGVTRYSGQRGDAFDVDALAIIAQMTTNGSTPSEARQGHINQLVLDLKGIGTTGAANVWALLDWLAVHAADTEIQALTEWRQHSGVYDPAKVGTPSFTAGVGFSSTTSSNRITSIWELNDLLGNYTLNDASVGFIGDVVNASYFCANAGFNRVRMRGSLGNNYEASMNSSFISGSGDWGALSGMFVLDRNSSANFDKYTDTTLIQTNTVASSDLNATELLYPAILSGGTQISQVVWVGASVRSHLTQIKASFDKYLATF